MPEDSESTAYQPTVLGAIWRFRWLMLAFLIVGGALGVVYATLQPERYEAIASFVVQDPRASTLFETLAGQQPDRFVGDQVAILESTVVAERAAQMAAQSGATLTADDFLEDGQAVSDPDSDHIQIRFQAGSPESAVLGANTIANVYQAIRRESTAQSYESALQQLDQSIRGVAEELDRIAEQIAAQLGPDPAMEELDRQFADALIRLADLQQALAAVTPDTSPETAEATRAALDDLLRQFQTLQVIASLEDQNPGLAALLEQQTQAIGRQSTLIQRRDELTVDAALQSTGVVVFAPALEAEPAASDLMRALPLGLAAGGLIGAAASYSLALRRRRFSDCLQPGPIVGAPLLGEVPDFRDEGIRRELPVQHVPASASAEAFRFIAAALDVQASARIQERPTDGRTPTPSPRGPRSLAVVSARLGDGKSVVAVNTALASARQGNRVLVIDADFGNQRTVSLLSGSHTGPGLTELIHHGRQLREVTQLLDLGDGVTMDLLPRGQEEVTAPEFFGSPAIQAFLTGIGGQYDLVMIDTPPLLQVAYAGTIVRSVDAAVVVLPHGGDMRTASDLSERLALLGSTVAGYVYNRAPLRDDMVRGEGSLKDVLGLRPDNSAGRSH